MMFHPAATGKLADNLYAVRTGIVSFFVFEAGELALAFDAGLGAASAINGLGKIGLAPGSITHLFLTHSDSDHVGGAASMSKATIYLPAAEEQMIDGSTPRGKRRYNKPLPRPYQTLQDGDTVHAGGAEVRAISTPGHTPGSMSYLLNGSILFTGDTMGLSRGLARRFVIGMDKRIQEDSLAKLAGLEGIELVCTAHSGCKRLSGRLIIRGITGIG